MKTSMSFSRLLSGLMLLQAFVSASPMPYYLQKQPISRRNLRALDIMQELAPQLSTETIIVGPEDPLYKNLTERWSIYEVPDVQVVIQVAVESDIATAVRYANANGIDFMAVNRGHSLSIEWAKGFRGVQIDLKELVGVEIQPDGETAIIKPGSYGLQVITDLHDAGYVTPTGAHECVGYTGLALGGGHGRYEGKYGLVSDNIVSLQVVLSDGREIQVDDNNYPDLFWAMKGAGHNFGIVTALTAKIYPIEHQTWHYHNYYWSGDKLEEIFEKLNKFHDYGKTPVGMGVNFGSLSINPTYSNDSATINWSFVYEGSAEEAEAHLAPFNAIDALSEESGDIPYTEVPAIQGTSFASGGCAPSRKVFSHALLKTYNVTNERITYENFNKNALKYPQLRPGIVYEGYSTAAVEEFGDDDSAYPWRHEYHIVYIVTHLPEESPSGKCLYQRAKHWVNEVRDSWNQNRDVVTYVNYATGEESLESTYGYEPWRITRLRELKNIYDPANKFRYYNPVNPE